MAGGKEKLCHFKIAILGLGNTKYIYKHGVSLHFAFDLTTERESKMSIEVHKLLRGLDSQMSASA